MKTIARALLPLLLLLLVCVAPLSANDDGDMMDCPALRLADLGDELFISVRHYSAVDPDDIDTLVERTRDGFVPIISESPGFVLYVLSGMLPDQGLAVNIFQSEEEMLAANEKAAEFVRKNLASMLTVAPQITAGVVTVLALPGHCADDMQDGESMADDAGETEDRDAMEPLFLSFRHYSGVDPADVPAIADAVAADFVQVISDSEGFRLYLNFSAANGEVYGAINVFTSEEEMTASNERAAEFVAEALAELLPEAPTIIAGDTSIFQVADLESMMAMDVEEQTEG
ncbi:MAG: hypothetical protein OXP68_02890 [Anaerolineaceae bacterium]|nr:hypothetical protein [Anaerolineaceae bacterium]MDE0328044.1 hypothetical protein [Anaerolineaceae bacterium]